MGTRSSNPYKLPKQASGLLGAARSVPSLLTSSLISSYCAALQWGPSMTAHSSTTLFCSPSAQKLASFMLLPPLLLSCCSGYAWLHEHALGASFLLRRLKVFRAPVLSAFVRHQHSHA